MFSGLAKEVNYRQFDSIAFSKRRSLPKLAGAYVVEADKQVVYVGSSTNLFNRWGTHERISEIASLQKVIIFYYICAPNQIRGLEEQLLNKLNPTLNGKRIKRARESLHKFSVYVPGQLIEKLYKHAKSTRRTIGAEVVISIQQHLKSRCS